MATDENAPPTHPFKRTVAARVKRDPAFAKALLEELLRDMPPEAIREAFDWGPDRGREAVDE